MPVVVNESVPATPHKKEADGSVTPLLFQTSAGAVSYSNPDVEGSGNNAEEALNVLFEKLSASGGTGDNISVLSAALTTYVNPSSEAAFTGQDAKAALDLIFHRLYLLEKAYSKPSVTTPSITSPVDGTTVLDPYVVIPTSSAFSATYNGKHSASEWRVCAESEPDTPLWTSGIDLINLVSHKGITLNEETMPGLGAVTAEGGKVLLQVRYRANNINGEAWSEWSTPVSLTLAVPAPKIYTTDNTGSTFTVPNGVTELAVLVVPSGGSSSATREGGIGGYAGAGRITVTPGESIPVTLPAGTTDNPGASFGTYITCSNTEVAFASSTEIWQCKTGNGGRGIEPGAEPTATHNGGNGGGFSWQNNEEWQTFVLSGPSDVVPGDGSPATSSENGAAGTSLGTGSTVYGGGAGGSGEVEPTVLPGNSGIIVILWGSLLTTAA